MPKPMITYRYVNLSITNGDLVVINGNAILNPGTWTELVLARGLQEMAVARRFSFIYQNSQTFVEAK